MVKNDTLFNQKTRREKKMKRKEINSEIHNQAVKLCLLCQEDSELYPLLSELKDNTYKLLSSESEDEYLKTLTRIGEILEFIVAVDSTYKLGTVLIEETNDLFGCI